MNSLLAQLRFPLTCVAGFSFVANLLLLAPALFMLQVFDRVLASGSRETLAALLIGVALALVLVCLLDSLRSRLQALCGQIVNDALSPLVAGATLRARARAGAAALTSDGLRDVAALRALFASQGLVALFDAPWLLLYVAVIALAHPLLGAGAALAACLMVALALVNDRLTRPGLEAAQQHAAKSRRYLEDSMVNAEVVQTLGMTGSVLSRWRALDTESAVLQRPVAARGAMMAALTRASRQGVQVGMLALGAWLVITHAATPGVMIATTVLLGRALAPVEQIVGSWRVLADARAAWGRLRQVLALGPAMAVEPMPLPEPIGRLAAENVSWRPPRGDRLVLADVSFSLAAGESLAIIGPSAAGKSTLVRLLTGLWSPSAGVVRLDGADVTHWPRERLGPSIGYLPQDVELFAGTVADNIARLGTTDGASVVEAARRARVHEMILQLPQGYDTLVDPHGTMLSPGQRQRIGLARALHGEPRLVVLDEPNANLDGAGETALAEAIASLHGKATVVIVTHRATLTQQIDKILVLDGGRVVRFGPAAEVLQSLRTGAQVVSLQRPGNAATAA
ncbi:MAG: type I secretion system permease/ATPase [Caldimonas sp.]